MQNNKIKKQTEPGIDELIAKVSNLRSIHKTNKNSPEFPFLEFVELLYQIHNHKDKKQFSKEDTSFIEGVIVCNEDKVYEAILVKDPRNDKRMLKSYLEVSEFCTKHTRSALWEIAVQRYEDRIKEINRV